MTDTGGVKAGLVIVGAIVTILSATITIYEAVQYFKQNP